MNLPERFIVIDDDRSNNLICEYSLRRFSTDTDIKTFLDPEVALEHIASYGTSAVITPTVLFLDINMPVVNGWEFLEIFANFSENIKQQFSIYILSSSIDLRDLEKADKNPLVKGFLSKPLSKKIINSIFDVEQDSIFST